MEKQERRTYTQEQKDEAVKLALGDGNVAKVARNLGLNQETLRLWISKTREEQAPGGACWMSRRKNCFDFVKT